MMFKYRNREVERKLCRRCGEELPVTEFERNVLAKDGLMPVCRKCEKEEFEEREDKRKRGHF